MRALAMSILALGLAAAPVVAASGPRDSGSPAKASAHNGAAAKKSASPAPAKTPKAHPAKASPAKSTAAAKPEPSPVEIEMQQLRDLLESQAKQLQEQNQQLKEQQKKMESLEQQLNAASPGSAAAPAPAAIAPTAVSSAAVTAAPVSSSSNSAAAAPAKSAADNAAQNKPPEKLGDLMGGKLNIGATVYAFYSVFPQTGFGPQTLDNTDIYPGPGNDGYNEFNINRTYINITYTPTPALTFRVTPNIYREVGGTTGEKLSATSGQGGNYNGNYGFRLKYGYVQWNNPFKHSSAFGKDVLVFGQQQQPLTDWEEGLYGYRFVNLTPWNYLSLSSTFVGARLHGPIEFNGKQYIDYGIGVFNDSSFHAYEVGEQKQVMARVSVYPFGAVSKYQGLGITGFVDYGYKDQAIDQATQHMPELRVAALMHFETRNGDYGLAGEYDYGRNAFSEGNLFSGSGPADALGLGPTIYAPFTDLTAAILSGVHTHQQGFDFFGHARIANSPFYLFGMFEQFNPNTNVSNDPIDFRTVIGGISYHYNKYWQFAIDSKNIIYYHNQFTFPVSELALLSPSLAAQYPAGIPNAVPGATNQVSFNILFNY